MPLKALAVEAGPEMAGSTVAAAVRRASGLSHSMAKGLVVEGLVTLNGRVVKDPARRLAAGDRLEARFDPATRYRERRRPDGNRGFRIVMEDDHLVAVDKEAGLITVPAPSRPSGTLADKLVEMYASRGFRSPRLWVVHRIDRFTSGLVLFARSELAAAALIEQFGRREARREYLAICTGVPEPASRRLESWLARDPRSLRMRETRDRSRGLRAACSYRVEATLPGAALVRVALETGRRNQIRVQFAGIGHPLVGDRKYGVPSPLIRRVALHAAHLGFLHPRTGRPVSLESPLPGDMARLLRALRRP